MGGRKAPMASPADISVEISDSTCAARTYPGDGSATIAQIVVTKSTFGLLARTSADHPTRDFLGYRTEPGKGPYTFASYSEVFTKIVKLANSLISGFGLSPGDRVGVYGKNCPAWTTIQYAINAAGCVLVPIYDTLGADIVEYVCNHAEVSAAFVAEENWAKWEAAADKCPTVKNVVKFDVGAIESVTGPASIAEAVAKGVENRDALPDTTADDLNVIMYTSGTTGAPKGVMLTNSNILSSVGSAHHFFMNWSEEFEANDIYLSFLPLSHIFEQQAQALFIGKGAKIGFYSGNIKLLLSDMEALRPTVFAGVPRVFARFQQKIEENVEASSFIKKTLFRWAYDRQLQAEQNPGTVPRAGLWDTLVMNKVRDKLLPDCRLIITGSAPMSAQTNDFLKVCLNIPVVQGYGLTETVGGMNCSAPAVSKSGTCGGPLPGCEMKLADLPEMGYLSTNKPYPQGEVCVKGLVVFKGYYKNEEATAKAFDEDGWFYTGDVGRWNDDGSMQIIDRAKNLFKLAQGEYVSPEALEQEYAKAKLVLQIFVYGNSLESTLLAVVVPDSETALAWGKGRSLEDIAKDPKFKTEVLAQLLEMHGKAKFKSYEKIRDVIIEVSDLNELGQGFTVDNDLMTPSFKLKRPQLNRKYKNALDELYAAKEKKFFILEDLEIAAPTMGEYALTVSIPWSVDTCQ